MYLADKYKKLISEDPVQRIKCIEWLMFQMGGIGPMQGQANVFGRYFEEKFLVLYQDIEMNVEDFMKCLINT